MKTYKNEKVDQKLSVYKHFDDSRVFLHKCPKIYYEHEKYRIIKFQVECSKIVRQIASVSRRLSFFNIG